MADEKEVGKAPKPKASKALKGCLWVVGLALVAVAALAILGAVIEATLTPEERARRDEAAAKRAAEREAAEKLELATGKYCVEAADEPKKLPNGVWFCDYCFVPAVNAAIMAKLKSSSSYEDGRLGWTPSGESFVFMQDFTADNEFGVELDYRAVGIFDKTCAVTTIAMGLRAEIADAFAR